MLRALLAASRWRGDPLATSPLSFSSQASSPPSPPSTVVSLPEVDVASFAADALRPGARAAALSSLRDALATRGAFSLRTASLVPPSLVARVYSHAAAFHALPASAKQHVHHSCDANARGWVPNGEEPNYEEDDVEGGTTAVVSHVAAFDLANDLPSSDSRRERGVGPNAWPSADLVPPGFKDDVSAYYSATTRVAAELFRALAECFGLPADALARGRWSPRSRGTMRLLSYPGSVASQADVDKRNTGSTKLMKKNYEIFYRADACSAVTPHTDFEAFTLLHSDAPGLQFWDDARRAWGDAPVPDLEHHTVIIDDMVERLTNGVLRATKHRVPHVRSRRRPPVFLRFIAPCFYKPVLRSHPSNHACVFPFTGVAPADQPHSLRGARQLRGGCSAAGLRSAALRAGDAGGVAGRRHAQGGGEAGRAAAGARALSTRFLIHQRFT